MRRLRYPDVARRKTIAMVYIACSFLSISCWDKPDPEFSTLAIVVPDNTTYMATLGYIGVEDEVDMEWHLLLRQTMTNATQTLDYVKGTTPRAMPLASGPWRAETLTVVPQTGPQRTVTLKNNDNLESIAKFDTNKSLYLIHLPRSTAAARFITPVGISVTMQ